MPTRAELVKFINDQLDPEYRAPETVPGHDHSLHHYGRCELKALLDQIYGGPPQSDEEDL